MVRRLGRLSDLKHDVDSDISSASDYSQPMSPTPERTTHAESPDRIGVNVSPDIPIILPEVSDKAQ